MSDEQGEQIPAVDQNLPEASPVDAENVESPDAPIEAAPTVDADAPAPEPIAPDDPDPLPPPVVETIDETLPEPIAPDDPDPLPPPVVETIDETLPEPVPEPDATPEPVNAFLNQVGRGGVYIREMGGECRQMVACTLVGVQPDGATRIRLGQAPGVREGEIIATYSEQHVPGTWHWA